MYKMTVAFQTNPELNRLFLAAHLGVLLHYPAGPKVRSFVVNNSPTELLSHHQPGYD